MKNAAEGDYAAVIRWAADPNAQDRARLGSPGAVMPVGPLLTHDWDAAINDTWDDWISATVGNPSAQQRLLQLRALELGRLALARGKFGDLHGGQVLITETPLDCRMCMAMYGLIAALAGVVRESETWFAQAIEMAPKLLQVYVDRGQARLDRGELAGALADATQGATLSPPTAMRGNSGATCSQRRATAKRRSPITTRPASTHPTGSSSERRVSRQRS
jgi:hypothetical protein